MHYENDIVILASSNQIRPHEMMTTTGRLIPPGPDERYDTAQELLPWMDGHFRQYGSIYKASVYGTSVYALNSPEYAKHVLSDNWQNYIKGQAIKRIALLLGNGLMVSEGESGRDNGG